MLLVLFFVFAGGCSLSAREASPGAGEPGRQLTVAHTSWEESVALAHLTRVGLEEELGYEVELEAGTSEEAFEGVASGEADVFQGIWRPRHNALISAHEGDIDMLGQLLFGTTRASLAVPSYMGIRRFADLEGTRAERALVLEADASGVGELPGEVFERHDLDPTFYPDSAAMMEEADRLYEEEEPFVMLAYSPHRMNLRYELVYLEGSDLLESVNRPSTLHSAARADLAEEDPLAHAFLEAILLTEYQMESLQREMRSAESPPEGARAWAASNEAMTSAWARIARESTS